MCRHVHRVAILDSWLINPLNPIVHFWLHNTAHCAEKVGQGEVGAVTRRVLCTMWLLGLALKRPRLANTGRVTPRPDCMDRLRKHYSHLAEGWFLAKKAAWALKVCMATDSAVYRIHGLISAYAYRYFQNCKEMCAY